MVVVSRRALPGLAALLFLDQRPRAAECHIRLKMNLIAAILVGLQSEENRNSRNEPIAGRKICGRKILRQEN
jgi:hypothetical protein